MSLIIKHFYINLKRFIFIVALISINHIVIANSTIYKLDANTKFLGVDSAYKTKNSAIINGNVKYFDSTLHPTVTYSSHPFSVAYGSWFNKNSKNMLYKNIILRSGFLFKWDVMETQIIGKSFADHTLVDWVLSDNLSFSYTHEKTNKTHYSHLGSVSIDLSNINAPIPYIAKGSFNHTSTQSTNGYGGYIKLGTPIQIFDTSVQISLTKVNWFWDDSISISYNNDASYFYNYSDYYTQLRDGANTNALIMEYSMLYTIKNFNLFGKYAQFSHNEIRHLITGSVESDFGIKDKSFFIRVEKDDSFTVIVGTSIKGKI